jgi:hypothetical protein
VSQTNLFSLIQDDGEEMDRQRDHESDPTCWKKRKRFQEPDKHILNFSGTGDRREEHGIAKNEAKAPACERSQTEPILAYRKPWQEGYPEPWSEESLKKEEGEEKNHPNPEVPEKLPKRQSRKKQKAYKENRVEGQPRDS